MKIKEINGFVIYESDRHGKNVKGGKKTTGMQVREYMDGGGYLLLHTVSFPINDVGKREAAIKRCETYINEQ